VTSSSRRPSCSRPARATWPGWTSVASRRHIIGIALCALLTVLGTTTALAAGPKLRIDRAAERSAEFAERTCDRDRNCVRHGVSNCRRQSRRIVICRIFDERDTRAQGRYLCSRLIRLALDPETRFVPVTGLGRWRC
jgi:hypothetical protein